MANSKCQIHGKIMEPEFLGNMNKYCTDLRYTLGNVYIYTLCPFPLRSLGKFCMLTKRKQDWWTDRHVKNSSGIPRPPTSSCMGFNIY